MHIVIIETFLILNLSIQDFGSYLVVWSENEGVKTEPYYIQDSCILTEPHETL